MSLIPFGAFQQLTDIYYIFIGLQPYKRPDEQSIRSRFRLFWFYANFINMNTILIWELITAISITNGSLLTSLTNFTYIGFMLVTDMKLLAVVWKYRDISSFMKDIYDIYPQTAEQQERYNVRKYLAQCRRNCIVFAALYTILVCTFNFFSFMQRLIYDLLLNVRHVEIELPYFIYIPWQWKDNFWYPTMFLIECTAGFFASAGQVSSDLLFYGAAMQILMHFDYVANSIKHYKVQAVRNGMPSEDGRRKDMKFLCGITEYHQKILSLMVKLNEVFGISLFFNLAASCIVICFVGFHMSIGNDPEMKLKWLLGFISTCSQIYLLSHFGELLIEASTNISEAVFNQDWHNADLRYKKMLILVAQRAQKPAYLEATSFLRISHGTMTSMMQLSYKFFALVRTMYAE